MCPACRKAPTCGSRMGAPGRNDPALTGLKYKTRPLAGFCFSGNRTNDSRSVGGFDRVRLQSLLPLDDQETHLLAFLQGLDPRHLDCAEMHEHILAAVTADEPETLRVVEPLHGTNLTFCHAHALHGACRCGLPGFARPTTPTPAPATV